MRKATFLVIWPLLALAAPRALPRGQSRAVESRHGDEHEYMDTNDASNDEHDDQWEHEEGHGHEHEHDHGHEDTTVDTTDTTDNSTLIPSPVAHTHGGAKADAASAAAHGAAHHHGGHTAPKVELDDAGIHYWHSFPPSYLAADFRLDVDSAIFGEEFPDDWVADEAGGRKGLALGHVASMLVAYFGILPIALALRSADHPLHYIVNGVFLALAVVSWILGAVYKSTTPDRYEGEAYSGMFNMLILLSLGLGLLDSVGVLQRTAEWWRGTPKAARSWSSFSTNVLRSRPEREWLDSSDTYAHQPLVEGTAHEEAVVFEIGDDEDEPGLRIDTGVDGAPLMRTSTSTGTGTGRFSPRYRSSRGSVESDHTLRDSPMSEEPAHGHGKFWGRRDQMGEYDAPYVLHEEPESNIEAEAKVEAQWEVKPSSQGTRRMSMLRLGEVCLTWIRRSQVVFAYVVVLTGLAVYTGMCRASFLASCAAHYIKGSIFFGYGVLTFARYLGAYADMGWAWNRAPRGYSGPTAEMVECGVIFTYGATNTWMERFGAKAGDPYSVKQVQHISIAVMFWFAGLSGILLESKTIRRLLGSSTADKKAVQPASYAFSFNPLPALVIAVTGLAMAAHHQDYVFQVEIHSLWGVLLAGGSVFRIITYTFLWLRPPTQSTLPSRPPTEILTAFGWASGGIVFILSSEEVMHAAMRAGYDDKMAFLNVTIALIALVFCWIVVVMAVKGWAVLRVRKEAQRLQSR